MKKFPSRNNVRKTVTKSYWSDRVRRGFLTLSEIPWVSITAMSTLFGVLMLFFYFRSIDFFPADFSSVVALGAATAAGTIAVVVALSAALFAPAAIYRHFSGSSQAEVDRIHLSVWELAALQLGGVGVLFAWISYADYRDCSVISSFQTAIATVLLLVALFVAAKAIWKTKPPASRTVAIQAVFDLLLFGLFPIAVLTPPLSQLFDALGMTMGVSLFGFWASVIYLNSLGAKKLNVRQISMTAVLVILLMFVVVPIGFNKSGFFPALVAQRLGIRSDGPVSLLVSKRPCELVSALNSKSEKKVVCADNDWNAISATVLSNLGERWLLELDLEKSTQSPKPRVILDRREIQAMIPSGGQPETRRAICEKRSSKAAS